MLSVESMLYVSFRIYLVNDPVGIFLYSSRKNYNFIVLAHFGKEFLTVWSDEEI